MLLMDIKIHTISTSPNVSTTNIHRHDLYIYLWRVEIYFYVSMALLKKRRHLLDVSVIYWMLMYCRKLVTLAVNHFSETLLTYSSYPLSLTRRWSRFFTILREVRACRARIFFAFYRFIIRAGPLAFSSRIRRTEATHEVESRCSLRM